jgi:hypothetical protein
MDEERTERAHSKACRRSIRLTLAQKLDIVRLFDDVAKGKIPPQTQVCDEEREGE